MIKKYKNLQSIKETNQKAREDFNNILINLQNSFKNLNHLDYQRVLCKNQLVLRNKHRQ